MNKRFITGAAVAALFTATIAPVTNSINANSAAATHTVAASDTNSDFLKTAAKQAQKVAKKYGLYPSVMIAQAIVESNWGQSSLAVNANNLFGIKADASWTGAVYNVETREEDSKGKSYYVKANFKKYASYQDSFDDNGSKLRNGVSWQPLRYQGAWLEQASSYQAATKALTGTYATDHNYNKTLNKRIEASNLTQYDPKISNKSKKYLVAKSGATYAWPTNHSVSQKAGSVTKGTEVKVDQTITYYNGTKRMHVTGNGWLNESALKSKAKSKSTVSKTKVVKTTKPLMHNAYAYDKNGKKAKGVKKFKADTNIDVYGTKVIHGKNYYNIGNGHYLAAGNIDGTARVLKRNAYVYNNYANRDNNLVYKKNSSVATYGAAVAIFGKKYYKVGINQYIKKANFK